MSGTRPPPPNSRARQQRPHGPQRSDSRRGKQRHPQRRWAVTAAGLVTAAIFGIDAVQDADITAPTAAAGLGPDLHTLSVIGEALYLGGHSAVAESLDGGKTWRRLRSLNNADALAWATTDNAVLVGGPTGLYRSPLEALNFTRVSEGVPAGEVHALGGAGSNLYLASPEAGLLVSHDAGQSWQTRNAEAGRTFMGTILVDPTDPDQIIVADTKSGLRSSADGGRTFAPLGGPANARSAARNPANPQELIAVGADGAARSSDSGTTWQQVDVPAGTSKVQYSADGRTLYAATTLYGQPARVYRSGDDGASWQPTA